MEGERSQINGTQTQGDNGDEAVPLQEVPDPEVASDLQGETPHDQGRKQDEENLPLTKEQIANTVAVFSAYMGFGFCMTVWGPSLVDMANLMNTDIKTIVFIFTAQSGGAILGSIVVAFLLGKINNNLLLVPCLSVVSACLIVSPWLPNVTLLIVVIGFGGIFGTTIHTIVQVYTMSLWRRTRHKPSLMQGMFFSWSVAATICPHIIEPFLSKKIENESMFQNHGMSVVNASEDAAYNTRFRRSIPDIQMMDNSQNSSSIYGKTRVQYGILTVACIISLAAGICLFAFAYEGMKVRIVKCDDDGQQQKPKHNLVFRIIFILVCSAMFGLYISIETTIGNLLSTFVILGLSWEKYKGSVITSVYWGTFGLSRLCAVIVTRYVKPERMLAALILTIITSLTILSAAVNSHEVVAWICFSIIGIAEGPFFGCGLIFVGSVMKMDGPFSAALTISIAISIMSASAIVGYIFETFGHMTMLYYLLATSIFLAIVFVVVYLLATRVHPHQGAYDDKRETERSKLNASDSGTTA